MNQTNDEMKEKIEEIVSNREKGFLCEEGGKSHAEQLTHEEAVDTLTDLFTEMVERERADAVMGFKEFYMGDRKSQLKKIIPDNIWVRNIVMEMQTFEKLAKEYLNTKETK